MDKDNVIATKSGKQAPIKPVECFSRMRSEGLSFSLLGGWGLKSVCGSLCVSVLYSHRRAVYGGKVRKGDVL